MWHVTPIMWHLSLDTWQHDTLHVTRDMRHMVRGLGFMMSLTLGGKGLVSPSVINRPGVAGAVLQSASSLIDFSHSAFSSRSSWYHKSQTVRARELKFWENVHPPNMSRVTCHVSRRVTYHVSHVILFFFIFSDKVVKLIGGGYVINGANPV